MTAYFNEKGINRILDRPKQTFQSVKWVSMFNSLAAEKNVEIVNNVSSVLSNLSLAGEYRIDDHNRNVNCWQQIPR